MGVAYNFNPAQHEPNFGGGGDSLSVGKHPVVGSKVELKNAKDNNGNGYLALTVTAIDGPSKGGTKTIRYNLHNSSAVAQRIAEEQLSATCLVMGVVGPWSDTDVLLNKPFVIDIVPQPGSDKYTEVSGVFTMDGRTPQEAKSNPPQAAGNAPAGFNASSQTPQNNGGQGGGNGGGSGGWGGGQNGGGQAQGGSGGGWQPAAGADTGAGAGGQGGGSGGGWGAGAGGGQSGGNGGGGGGWSQNSGGGGGSTGGGWGQSA